MASSLSLAAPAHAAYLGTFSYSGSNLTIQGNVGDTFGITNGSGQTIEVVNIPGSGSVSSSGIVCDNTLDCDWVAGMKTFTVIATGTLNINQLTGPAVTRTLTITAPSSGGDAPPPLIQQFGKPASGTCDAAAPLTLNWAGVASGGWGDSWAQWMNTGRGGPVCNRMLVYSTAQSRWVVG